MKRLTLFVVAWMALGVAAAHAVHIETVPVGNPGNANDSTGYGKVDYNYQIGKYEVTNAQYTAFLNAVDAAGLNPNGIYNPNMGSDASGGISYTPGNTDGTKYATKANMDTKPVNYVSFYDALRFTNWLHNDQGGAGTTEYGAYTFTGGVLQSTTGHLAGAKYWLPSENEWYKAAYHQPMAQGGDSDNYWLYPTRTNAEPYSVQPPGSGAPAPANTVNFYRDDGAANGYNDGYAVTGSTRYVPTQDYLTEVGAYTQSGSFYGTFDQGGNVYEWYETQSSSSRGGSCYSDSGYVAASYRNNHFPTIELHGIGFRVASAVPEPSTFVLLGMSALGLLAFAWRRRKRRE